MRLELILLLSVLLQFIAWTSLSFSMTLRARIKFHAAGIQSPVFSTARFWIGFSFTLSYLLMTLGKSSSLDLPPAMAIHVVLILAAISDIWIERIPIETNLLLFVAGFLVSHRHGNIQTCLIHSFTAFSACFFLQSSLSGFLKAEIFSFGDILFTAALCGAVGFMRGFSAFGLGMAGAGLFAALFRERIGGRKATIPMIPFICLALALLALSGSSE